MRMCSCMQGYSGRTMYLAYSKVSARATSISRDSSPIEALGTLLPRSPTSPTSESRRTTQRPALPEADVLAESMAPEPWLVPVLTLAVVLASAIGIHIPCHMLACKSTMLVPLSFTHAMRGLPV